jgi:hypothetical protein
MTTATKTVNRSVNPYAPTARLKNQALTQGSPYETLKKRIQPLLTGKKDIDSAIAGLRERLGGQLFQTKHFGRLEFLDVDLIDINVDIQRFLENKHIAEHIIEKFDPRIMQPINVIYIRSTGRYSAWDGQQSSAAFALMLHFGLMEPGTLIPCKVVDDDLEVPGSTLTGEALGNMAFRWLNGKGRLDMDVYFQHRSMVNGVRRYDSDMTEDLQAEEIQQVLERHHMFPAPARDAQGRKALPGMVTHLSAVYNIAGHSNSDFEESVKDLDWAMGWHQKYFASEKGVNGGFILAFGRLHAQFRADTGSHGRPAVCMTPELEQELYLMIKDRHLTPAGFHANCQARLKSWHIANKMHDTWSDSCLTPFLVMDWMDWGGKAPMVEVPLLKEYAGM